MRAAGILLPLSSLPGPYGIGTLGEEAKRFVDFLAAAGQSYWQILPIGPTGYGDSPYQSFSAFAANPYFIDPGLLLADGLLEEGEAEAFDWGGDETSVDYGALYRGRHALLKKAVDRLEPEDEGLAAFCAENAFWLEDYALFMALKGENGQKSWFDWPDPVRLRQPEALRRAAERLAGPVRYWKGVQYLFHRQWTALKAYANEKGVSIIGDIPIYVSPDSSDIWAGPELFQLTADRRMAAVAGCPPDAFAADGQLWGNPLYDWDYHYTTGYAWWVRRLAHACTVYDVVRIDHFRGFESYFAIPAKDTTAKNGVWRKGPGMALMRALHKGLPTARIIAEDLGYLTPEVKALLEASGYPGMKVLQFAFDRREAGDYMPHGYIPNSVVYTGTHDNTTTAAWQTEADPEDVALARAYMACGENEALVDAFIRTAFASVSDTAVIPMQDWLALPASARMNTPSKAGGNWQWRMAPGAASPALAGRIRRLTELYERLGR